MRIGTWNINGTRARLDFVRHYLEAQQPDIIGLQELKIEDADFPADAFAALGYRAVAHGQKSWNGVAILARETLPEPEVLQVGLPGQEDFGARLLTARIGELVYTTVYCPNGKSVSHDDYPRKLAWFDALTAHLDTHHAPDRPGVLCGDFNICRAPLDSWSEEKLGGGIFHTDDERARMQALVDWGWRDLFREKYPDERSFSWWDYRAGAFHKKQGLRIDLILATAPVADRLEDAVHDRDYRKKKDGLTASDHAPVHADLAD